MKMVFALIASIILTSTAHASKIISGYERGNGGYYVHCNAESEYGQGLFAFDRIEGSVYYNLQTSPRLTAMQDEREILNTVISALEKVDVPRAKLYRVWTEELFQNMITRQNLHPVTTMDSGYANVPNNCEIKQAAVFFADSEQKQIKFFFDKSFVEGASALDKAFLILHEVIYREARLLPNVHLNSAPSRYLNAWLFANVDKLVSSEWVKAVHTAQFRDASYHGISLILTYKGRTGTDRRHAPIQYYPSGALRRAILFPDFSILLNGTLFERKNCMTFPAVLASNEYVEFYESGKVKTLAFSKDPDPSCGTYKNFNILTLDEAGNLIETKSANLDAIFTFED